MSNKPGHRRTIEARINMRNGQNLRLGHEVGWADEALNYYLSGVSVSEIAECYEVRRSSVYSAISKAALYRLMQAKNMELMADHPDLKPPNTPT